jgi:hypothetical protein
VEVTMIDIPWPRGALALILTALVGLSPTARAEEEPSPSAPTGEGTPAATEIRLGVIQGRRVNVRVGPRIDVRPVTQLDDGAVVLIVERVPGWLGVRIPAGFPAALSTRYVTTVGNDAVRVDAQRLNLRAHPPQDGKPMPGAFRDHPAPGALLPLIEREGAWAWVLAPESVRAYVSEEFVRELGAPEDHAALLAAARSVRAQRADKLAAERRARAAEVSGVRLREAIGSAQQALYRLRLEAGLDRVPVAEVINALEAAIEQNTRAPVSVRKLAYVLRQDLESELELRTARKDAEVARLRGLEPARVEPVAPKTEAVVVRGEIRWEPAPTWRNGGAFVLWAQGEPTHVLRLTTGLPHPIPDLAAHDGKGIRTIEGRMPGERVFGLPVIEVRSISR